MCDRLKNLIDSHDIVIHFPSRGSQRQSYYYYYYPGLYTYIYVYVGATNLLFLFNLITVVVLSISIPKIKKILWISSVKTLFL